MHRGIVAAGLAMALGTASPALAGPVYSWHWTPGSGGAVSNSGGVINWIDAQFDTSTNHLSWHANFSRAPGTFLNTSGFTLALNDGPNPKGHAGELSLLHFDASGSNPEVTMYGYNGRNDTSSWYDGSRDQSGNQTPDRVLSSKHASATNWLLDTDKITHWNGTRTLGFTIDVTDILGHTPIYPETSEGWHGIGFNDKIGVWMHTFAGLSTDYYGDSNPSAMGYLKKWSHQREGWLDLTDGRTAVTDPVPEPSGLALIGVGIVAGAIAKRRRRSE